MTWSLFAIGWLNQGTNISKSQHYFARYGCRITHKRPIFRRTLPRTWLTVTNVGSFIRPSACVCVCQRVCQRQDAVQRVDRDPHRGCSQLHHRCVQLMQKALRRGCHPKSRHAGTAAVSLSSARVRSLPACALAHVSTRDTRTFAPGRRCTRVIGWWFLMLLLLVVVVVGLSLIHI